MQVFADNDGNLAKVEDEELEAFMSKHKMDAKEVEAYIAEARKAKDEYLAEMAEESEKGKFEVVINGQRYVKATEDVRGYADMTPWGLVLDPAERWARKKWGDRTWVNCVFGPPGLTRI